MSKLDDIIERDWEFKGYDAAVLKQQIREWHNAQTLSLLEELLEKKVAVMFILPRDDPLEVMAVPTSVIQSYISKYKAKEPRK